MVEIAIAIAVVAFALVAIIGVLPTGFQVQKLNRENTIINQDGTLWLEAIRSGSLGLDYLTNHVDIIQIVSRSTGTVRTNNYPIGGSIRTGQEIVGLLSVPRFTPNGNGHWTNTVRAFVRAISGMAAEKTRKNDFAFSYRLTSELSPLDPQGGIRTNWNELNLPAPEKALRQALFRRALAFGENAYDLRLNLDWPVYVNKDGLQVGANRRTFRTIVSGRRASLTTNNLTLHFLQPSHYVFVP